MLSNYESSCKVVVGDFLQKSTRFECKDFELQDYKDFVYKFSIVVENELDIESHYITIPGANTGSSKDFAFYNESDLRSKIQERIQQELGDKNNLDLLFAIVEEKGFGFFKENTAFKNIDTKYHYIHICASCHGAGKMPCHTCSGSGKVSCYQCSGSGKRNCDNCGGSGRYQVNGHLRSCLSCGGGGKQNCSYCNGSGKKSCNTCSGRGKVTCEVCNGSGKNTDIYNLYLFAKPFYKLLLDDNEKEFIEQALHKTLIYNMQDFGNVVLSSREASYQTNEVVENYQAEVPFATFSVSLNNIETKMIIYGENMQIFDAGEILDHLLKNDLDKLKKAAKISFLNPFAAFVSFLPVKVFFKSEKHTEMLEEDFVNLGRTLHESLGKSNTRSAKESFQNRIEKSYELLGRALSKQHIEDSFIAIHNIVDRVRIASKINWFIFTFLIMLVLTMADRVDKFFSSNKYFIYKKDGNTYLNPSIYNADGIFDIGNFLNLFSLDIFFNTMIGFMIIIGIGMLCNKLYWRLIGGKTLSVWIKTFGGYNPRFWLRSFMGYIVLHFFFYVFPMYFDSEGKFYGIFTKEETKTLLEQIKHYISGVSFVIDSIFALLGNFIMAIYNFIVGLF